MIPGRYRTGGAPIHIGNKATALKGEHITTNNGSSYNWKRPQLDAQVETTTTTVYRRVRNIRRMETPVCSLPRTTELTIPQAPTNSRSILPTSYDELLADGARDRAEADLWIQLSKDLHYLLINVANDKQLSFADNIHYKHLVSRHGDNYTGAFQYHLVHAASGTLPSF